MLANHYLCALYKIYIIAYTLIGVSWSYSVDYFDCSVPKNVQTIQQDSLCENNLAHNSTPTRYQLLQRTSVKEMTGFSCSIQVSRFAVYCGVYGHMKFKRIPVIQENMNVAASDCETFYRRKSFRTPDKEKHSLAVPGRTVIRSFDSGQITDSGDVSCKGQSVKEPNGQIVERSVEMSQYTITIREEQYELRGSVIDVVTNHIQLPRSCRVNSGFCATTETSYLWTIPRTRCNLEKIQDVSFNTENGLLVDHSHKILLKINQAQPSPEKCPVTQILSTEYNDLFLAVDTKARFHDLGNSLQLDTYSRALADYVMYQAENKIALANSFTNSALCRQDLQENDKIHPLDKSGRFATRKGQVVFAFKCSRRTGKIALATDCYEDIPLEGGGYVDASTLVWKRKSPKMACSDYHPMMIKAKESWIQLNPNPKSKPAPMKSSVQQYVVSHEDISQGGLYTESELKSWRQHLEMIGYSQALVKKLTYGVCLHEGECASTQESTDYLGYNLNNLEEKLEDKLNLLQQFQKMLIENAAYVSALVLTIETAKVLFSVCALAASLSNQGIRGAKIIFISLFCSSYLKYLKLQENEAEQTGQTRRYSRAKTTSAEEEEEMETST